MDASVSSSLGAMGSLLKKLDMLLLEASQGDPGTTVPRPKMVVAGMQLLREDLHEICTYLEDLSELEDPPPTARSWMKQVRELSYDMDDYIDSFAWPGRSATIKVNHFPMKKKVKRHTAVAIISKFRVRAQQAIERHERYELGCRTFRRRNAPVGPMFPAPYEEDANLVIDDRTSEFIESLAKDGDKKLKVVCILGSGGIGKTTLVRSVYKYFRGQFDCYAFIQMSRKPSINTVLRDILIQVQRKQAHDDCQDLDLIGKIREYLKDKRYLIIIDDLWATTVWDIISHAFPESTQPSRIFTTTEIKDVALSCCCYHSGYVFEMEPLNHDHSRKLFNNTLFLAESDFPQQFREVSNRILEICGGFPLATVSIASLLGSHPVPLMEKWTYICHSLSSVLRTTSTSEGMRVVLNFSYNNLSHNLKTCLLYLNKYPEALSVCKEDLVRQWVAEGFIEAAEGRDMAKVAESYFDELIERRFLQPACIKHNDEVISCTVHDMIHDLIACKSSEENFIVVVKHYHKNVELSDKVRRLSLHFADAKYAKTPKNIGMSQVRSLTFFGLFECMPCIAEFKLLRVLNLQLSGHHGNSIIDLTGISELLQLRYLKVVSDGCIELPKQMGGLHYLETLDIDTKVTSVPWDIINLPSLLHLHLPFDTNLIDLILTMRSASLQSLGKLTSLQDLRLTCYTLSPEHLLEALGSILGGHGGLKTLTLVPSSSHKNAAFRGPTEVIDSWDSYTLPLLLQILEWSPCGCIFSSIPIWIGELGNLCILKIAVRELRRHDVDILRGLPALTALSLYVQKAPIAGIVFDKVGFSVLKYFKFKCPRVPRLKFEMDAMPKIRKLKLGFNAYSVDQYCSKPICIEYLSGLKEISVKICGARGVAESALTASVTNHPSNPIINLKVVNWTFYDDKGRSTETVKVKGHATADFNSRKYQTQNPFDRTCSQSLSPSHQPSIIHPGGEVIQAVSFANSVACKVFDVIKRYRSLKTDIKRGLEYIGREMNMVSREIKLKEERSQGVTHEIKIVLLKELAYEIEDFIDTTTWVPTGASVLFSSAVRMVDDPRPEILKRIENFKTRIQRVRDWQPDAAGPGGHGGEGDAAWAPAHATYSPEADLVGICKHRDELGRLLGADEREELKVISIVGCRGVGKTALARVAYDHFRYSGEYDCVAWVVASECRDPEDLLRKVLEEAHRTAQPCGGAAEGSTPGIEQTSLRSFLRDKRYFVVIDDVDHRGVWQAIKHEFPEESHNSSTIIVTTSVHSVAAECSWGSHVYTMQCLGKDESEQVFWRTVGPEIRSPALDGALEGILKKCGGLPLALISVAKYLRRRGQAERCVPGGIKIEHCKGAARALGHKILEGQDAEFKELNRALLRCYNNLPDYVHQSCLLYASMFPRGHPINCERLFRRWKAEGLVVAQDTVTGEEGAKGCLEELIDRCFIEPLEINNDRIARCRVHSIMLEFIIHKAVSKSFFALVYKDEPLSKKGSILDVSVRRLCIQDCSKKGVDDAVKDIDISVIRSLAIFKSPLPDLQACKLLRVLDLEGCKGFNNDTVRAICKQRFLRYLSLRGTDVVNLPSEIQCLERLETLDIRDTGVEDLPIEVISLPLLAHLFGRFQLAHGIKEEMSKKSRLQTLAGVIIAKADQSFQNIILHSPKLRKVKIYKTSSDSSKKIYQTRFLPKQKRKNNKLYPTTSTGSIIMLQIRERFTGSKALQVLSIDSSDFSTEFVSLLEASCAITSIKLRGKLKGLPDTTTLSQLVCLNKLLLISTGLSSQDLSALQILPCLEYLKLAEDHDGFQGGSFVVKSGGFPSLKRLCFEAPKLPEVQFQEGSMKSLTILDLLCPYPDFPKRRPFIHIYQVCDPIPMESRLGVAGVSYVENLNEVILHHSTGELNMQAWKEEAIRHKNRPSVKRQPKPIIHTAWS